MLVWMISATAQTIMPAMATHASEQSAPLGMLHARPCSQEQLQRAQRSMDARTKTNCSLGQLECAGLEQIDIMSCVDRHI